MTDKELEAALDVGGNHDVMRGVAEVARRLSAEFKGQAYGARGAQERLDWLARMEGVEELWVQVCHWRALGARRRARANGGEYPQGEE